MALALVSLPYLSGLQNGFVWLDHAQIEERGLVVTSLADVFALFTKPQNGGEYFRPVNNLFHSLDLWLWGLRPVGFHLSSLLLHLASVRFIFGVALRCSWSAARAFALVTLWGLHPVNAIAVGLISMKADLVVGACLSASLYLALDRRGSRVRQVLALLLVACALYSKETAFLFAPMLLGPGRVITRRIHRSQSYTVAVFVLTIAAAVHRWMVVPSPVYHSPAAMAERVATFATVYVDYLSSLALPLHPSVSDTVTRASALAPRTALGYAAAVIVAVTIQTASALRVPSSRSWLAMYNLALLPVAQIVPILHFRTDRFLYVPSLAFVALVLGGVAPFLLRSWTNVTALTSVLCLFIMIDVRTVSGYGDDLILFRRELSREPRYLEGHAALGRYYERHGDYVLSEQFYRASLKVAPDALSYVDYEAVVVNLSAVLLRQGRFEDAYNWIAQRYSHLKWNERREVARYNRAIAARRIGRFAEALSLFEQHLLMHPDHASTHYLAGLCAAHLGRSAYATILLLRYLELSPDAPDGPQVLQLIERMRQ